ncbi:threonine/serine exporter family protein [Propionivibrio limicola]|uniref:threonine/serine exporter family protein n=1 Tax=Propionivibrio limicola TaxID=167645 RepID=UPI001B85CC39|nr:threonine/serine exporter family protein [Propionivibrio limicola]
MTRLCARTALMLLQHGAESALVENTARRVGVALGAEGVEIALMSSAVVVTTLSERHCITTVRRNEDRGINVHVLIEVQQAMLDAETGKLDRHGYRERLEVIRPLRYPRWLVALVVGLACACFARLAHADLAGCLVAFVASGSAMFVRQHLAALHFSPLINFFATAFVATSIAAQGLVWGIGSTPKVAMAASVLMLVPGFPLINAVADMVKGYMNTGITRWAVATMLSAATCTGVILATSVWDVWGWL